MEERTPSRRSFETPTVWAAESSKVAAHHVSPSAVGSRERASKQVRARSTSPPRVAS